MTTPTQRIIIHQTGGPEVMQLEDATLPDPGPDEIVVEHAAIGLNYIDVYFRDGLYPAPNGVPFTPGHEGSGKVIAIGGDVSDLAVGDRIAYVGPLGSYARHRIIKADIAIKLPDSIDDETAAAMMLKGMTARYLLRKTYDVTSGTTLLFHAAAGGVGLIAGQWAKHLGATAIGTAGSDEKCALALEHGYAHCINYSTQDFAEEVVRLTDGKKCDVVFDGVGKATFERSLDCIKPFGLYASFGNASGAIDAFNLGILSAKGSLYVTRPTLFAHIATRAMLEENVNDLIDVIASGAVKIPIAQRFALSDAVEAHKALEARKTTGATVLLPNG
ncbi:MAG: quinone oxidoreductase family protein [Hyphomicrobiales bacterium]